MLVHSKMHAELRESIEREASFEAQAKRSPMFDRTKMPGKLGLPGELQPQFFQASWKKGCRCEEPAEKSGKWQQSDPDQKTGGMAWRVSRNKYLCCSAELEL